MRDDRSKNHLLFCLLAQPFPELLLQPLLQNPQFFRAMSKLVFVNPSIVGMKNNYQDNELFVGEPRLSFERH